MNPYVVVFSSRTTITLLGYAALPWLLLVVHRGLRDPRRLVVAGRVRAARDLDRRRGERGGDGRGCWSGRCCWPCTSRSWAACRGRACARSRGAPCSPRPGVAVVGRAGARAGRLRDRLPEVHRAGRLDLEHHEPAREPAADGLLAVVPGRGLRRRAEAVLRHLSDDAVRPAGAGGVARRAGAGAVGLRVDAALALRAVLPAAGARRAARDERRLPGGHAAAQGRDVHLQPRRRRCSSCAPPTRRGRCWRSGWRASGGAAFAELWRRARGRARRRVRARPVAGRGAGGLAALPLFEGRAVELTWKRIPAAWKDVAHDLDRGLPRGSRALVLPGQPFAFYRWGGTVDPILPALTDRPVAIRNVPPYDDLHAVDMLWTTDNLVHQQRLLPGELPPLLDLLGARAVVTGSDDDVNRSGGDAAGRGRARAGGAARVRAGVAVVRAGRRVRRAARHARPGGAAARGAPLRRARGARARARRAGRARDGRGRLRRGRRATSRRSAGCRAGGRCSTPAT